MEGWMTVREEASASFTDRKSVFIAEVRPVSTEEEALAFLEEVRKRTADARHHVYAYILRERQTTRFSDDGEPHGTAGSPILALLRRENLSDVALVVTRYFGGILLGTGGLVRAYTESARLALEKAGRRKVEKVARCVVSCSYAEYPKLESLLSGYTVRREETVFEEAVRAVFLVPEKDASPLVSAWSEITNGRVPMTVEGFVYDVL